MYYLSSDTLTAHVDSTLYVLLRRTMFISLTRTCHIPVLHGKQFNAWSLDIGVHATMQVNHGQGAPKYWSHAFFTDNSDNSLVHAFLGPSTLNTTAGDSNVQGLLLRDQIVYSAD